MAYSDYIDWKGWEEGAFGACDAYSQAYFDDEIGPFLRKISTTPPRLVEIGFGNGALLGWCRSRGIDVVGSEIQSALQERARRAGFPVVDNLSEIAAETADVVVAFDVFEHVPFDDLVALCRDIHRILKPEGHLIARFPNGDSPFSMVFQNGDPTHVHALGVFKLRRLMSASGLRLEVLKAPCERRLSLKGRLFLPVRRLMRAMFSTFVRYAFLEGDTPTTFTMNYVLVASRPAVPS